MRNRYFIHSNKLYIIDCNGALFEADEVVNGGGTDEDKTPIESSPKVVTIPRKYGKSKVRRCGKCNQPGHRADHCDKEETGETDEPEDVDEDESEKLASGDDDEELLAERIQNKYDQGMTSGDICADVSINLQTLSRICTKYGIRRSAKF